MKNNTSPLVPLGVGIGIGVCSLWALIELWPVLILGGAAYLCIQGTKHTTKENIDNANLD